MKRHMPPALSERDNVSRQSGSGHLPVLLDEVLTWLESYEPTPTEYVRHGLRRLTLGGRGLRLNGRPLTLHGLEVAAGGEEQALGWRQRGNRHTNREQAVR